MKAIGAPIQLVLLPCTIDHFVNSFPLTLQAVADPYTQKTMAKKKSTDDAPVPNPNSVQNRDIMQRLNFLYQASVFLGTPPLPPAAGPSTPQDESPSAPATVEQNEPELSRRQMRRREVRLARHPSTALDLSRACVKSMRVIGQKTTVRMCVEPFLLCHALYDEI